VRAKLIDRDGAPRWNPPALAAFTDRFHAALRPDDPVLWPEGTGGPALDGSRPATSTRQP
jgi:hypothetical protein